MPLRLGVGSGTRTRPTSNREYKRLLASRPFAKPNGSAGSQVQMPTYSVPGSPHAGLCARFGLRRGHARATARIGPPLNEVERGAVGRVDRESLATLLWQCRNAIHLKS